MELRLCLRFGNVAAVLADIEPALRVFLAVILYRAGKRRQHVHILIVMLGNIPLDLMEIAHRSKTGIRHDHHFALAADLMARGIAECLDDDRCFLTDDIRVQLLIFLDEFGCAALRQLRILRRILCDLIAGLVGHIIAQHIEDKAFFDRLPHTVNMERMKCAVLPLVAEHLQRFGLGRCGECEKRQIRVLSVGEHLLQNGIVAVDLVLGFALDLRIFAERFFGIGKGGFQLDCGAAGLRGMRLVHDHGEIAPRGTVHLLIDHRELLQGRDNNAHAAVECVAQIAGILLLVDRLDHAELVVKAGDRLL